MGARGQRPTTVWRAFPMVWGPWRRGLFLPLTDQRLPHAAATYLAQAWAVRVVRTQPGRARETMAGLPRCAGKEATMNVGLVHYLSTAYAIDPAVLAKRAEALGFDSLWLPEHPIMPVRTVTPFPLGGPIPAFYADFIDPFVGLARASAVTTTLKLGTGICLVPERNPLLLAKEIATLDHFSGGRFLFGIGAGWLKEETEIMGGDFAHRWTQTQEAVRAMQALWTQEEAEYHG